MKRIWRKGASKLMQSKAKRRKRACEFGVVVVPK